MKTLLFIPTYNERGNVKKILGEILALHLDLDILFMDDDSPDGTGRVLEALARSHPRVRVVHRGGKLGIGSAHQEGIRLAFAEGYQRLVTMDCDFTHPPEFIPDFLERSEKSDVVVGSRWVRSDSLDDWDPLRLVLTKFAHVLTKFWLKLPYDATGAFRVYRLDHIPPDIFDKVRSIGYSFFFESLFLLNFNGFSISEVPIVLPARTKGHSKMTFRDAFKSAGMLFSLGCRKFGGRKRFLLPGRGRPGGVNTADWNENSVVLIESPLAKFHRFYMLRLTGFFDLVKDKNAAILDLGCGSGPFLSFFAAKGFKNLYGAEPDSELIKNVPPDLGIEIKNCPAEKTEFEDARFDVVFVYCVLHHLKGAQPYRDATAEIARILKPGGLVFIVEPGRYKVFRALETASWALGSVSDTFRAFYETMEEERPEQHFFLKNHDIVRKGLSGPGFKVLKDDYFFYSWLFTARKT